MYFVKSDTTSKKVLGFLDSKLGLYPEDEPNVLYFNISKEVHDKYYGTECYTNGNIITADPPPNDFAELTDDGWVVDEEAVNKVLEATKKEASSSIDNAVRAIYQQYTPLQQEYNLREQQALAFAKTKYKGDVPHQVQAIADPTGLTSKQAADTIIAKAKAFHAAVDKLGELRMKKLSVKAMATIEEVNAHKDNVLAQIQAIAESL